MGLLFAVSGFAALVYQVSWQRILVLHTGVGIYSVAMIVSGFLAGLGLGSYLGGALSARIGPRTALRSFAGLELLVGAFAAVSCRLYYDVLYAEDPALYASGIGALLGHFLALVVPTTLMGMTLPLLVRASVSDVDSASDTIGYLYAINVVGAAVGALLTPWVLMRFLGIRGAVLAGVCGNVVVGLAALSFVRTSPDESSGASRSPSIPSSSRQSFRGWLGLYALGGFCALSLQVVWFRIVDVAVKSTAFTFGSVLAIYLIGLAAGSFLGAPLARRSRAPLQTYLACQCAILIYSALAISTMVALPVSFPLYEWFRQYWAGFHAFRLGASWDLDTIVRLYLLFPAMLYTVPTVLMGVSFPVLQRAVQDDPATSGLKVGRLQAANVAGNVAGSALAGIVLLERVGTTGVLRLLLVLGLVFAILGARRYGLRGRFGAAAAVLIALAALLPGQHRFWLPLHGGRPGTLIEEDASSVIAIRPLTPGRWRVTVNGQSHSWLPFGGIHTVLGAIPSLVHHAPRDVAVIGLGSGDTAWAAGARPETLRVDVLEIAAPQVRLLHALAEIDDPFRIRRFLADERIETMIADGRNALRRDRKTYDVVEMDALLPHHGFSGNLYSVEFFQEVSRRLNPSGLMCVWSATPRVRASFASAFPHVLEFGNVEHGPILVGSNAPIPLEPETWVARLRSREVSRYLAHAAEPLERVLRSAVPVVLEAPPPEAMLNRDLFPRDELSFDSVAVAEPAPLADPLEPLE
ncbi:MAG TPA: fused MFS/spermidine synthase [Vicinamibacteria bacterium]